MGTGWLTAGAGAIGNKAAPGGGAAAYRRKRSTLQTSSSKFTDVSNKTVIHLKLKGLLTNGISHMFVNTINKITANNCAKVLNLASGYSRV